MNLPLKIARRYLFAKRSTNVINIISGITVLGLSIGTAALILVLSVFNGLEGLIRSMTSNFNPDIKVAPAKGKVFTVSDSTWQALTELDGIAFISKTLEEIAYFEYRDNGHFGRLKGVDKNFVKVTSIDSTLFEGNYLVDKDENDFVILGRGMRNKLGVNIESTFYSIKTYMAKRENVGPMTKQFREKFAIPRGVFSIQPEYDQQYVISSLAYARELLDYEEEVSYLEIKVRPEIPIEQTQTAIQQVLGSDFVVQDRYEQDEAFNKVMNVEKWISFAILSLTLILVAFNMIGALWMVVMDKQKDISILKAMGATDQTVQRIFLNQGLLLSLVGMGAGFALALFLYFLQKQFGIVPSPGFIIEHYPVEIRWADFVVVALTVLLVGLIASIAPSLKARSLPAIVRGE